MKRWASSHIIMFTLLFVPVLAEAGLEEGVSAARRGDYLTALEELLPLAEKGNAEAQNEVATFYHNGLGVPQNYCEAVKWYRKSAEQGYAMAQFNLGLVYRNGICAPKDVHEAISWYRKAAEQGFAKAQYNLGILYSNGNEVPQDFKEAAKWFLLAAEQGDANAQYNIGQMYCLGEGVPIDFKEAAKWFRKGAGQKNMACINGLGWLIENGFGTFRDRILAYALYNIAAAYDLAGPATQNRNKLAEKMTPAEIQAAQNLSLELNAAINFDAALADYERKHHSSK